MITEVTASKKMYVFEISRYMAIEKTGNAVKKPKALPVVLIYLTNKIIDNIIAMLEGSFPREK